jgi:hypothetical protein
VSKLKYLLGIQLPISCPTASVEAQIQVPKISGAIAACDSREPISMDFPWMARIPDIGDSIYPVYSSINRDFGRDTSNLDPILF